MKEHVVKDGQKSGYLIRAGTRIFIQCVHCLLNSTGATPDPHYISLRYLSIDADRIGKEFGVMHEKSLSSQVPVINSCADDDAVLFVFYN